MKNLSIPKITTEAVQSIFQHDRLLKISLILGSMLIISGTLLPWFSFFAGLHTYPGISGLNGRILLIGGIVSLLLSLYFLKNMNTSIKKYIGVLGILLLAFTGWILVGLFHMSGSLASDPMALMKPGPGLYIIFLGAALICASNFLKQNKKSYEKSDEMKMI